MVIEMTTQNYCIINEQDNVCDNIVVWDGDTQTWTPPAQHLALVQATTPTKIWGENAEKTDWILVDSVGQGDIGWTWDGAFLTTNEPKPEPIVHTTVTGAQTL